jgi:hypothetical protein
MSASTITALGKMVRVHNSVRPENTENFINMINSLRLAALALAMMAVLSGCSFFGNNEPEYMESMEAEPLTIPEGLDTPAGPRPVVITVPLLRMPAGDELEPMPPRVVSTAGKQDTNTYMAWSAEGAYLMVKDSPESVARRLRFAIVNSGMTMLEQDDTGAHKFHYTQTFLGHDEGFFSRMAFWRDNKPVDYSGVFMTKLKADGGNTRVFLLFGTGEAVDTAGAEHILGIFMERLG